MAQAAHSAPALGRSSHGTQRTKKPARGFRHRSRPSRPRAAPLQGGGAARRSARPPAGRNHLRALKRLFRGGPRRYRAAPNYAGNHSSAAQSCPSISGTSSPSPSRRRASFTPSTPSSRSNKRIRATTSCRRSPRRSRMAARPSCTQSTSTSASSSRPSSSRSASARTTRPLARTSA